MNTHFTLIPVTRTVKQARNHPHVSLFYTKKGDLVFLFSPAFLGLVEHQVKLGGKVLCGYSAETGEFLVTPAQEGQSNARTIGKRPGFKGAGQLVLPCRNLPEGFPHWEGRLTPQVSFHEGGFLINPDTRPYE